MTCDLYVELNLLRSAKLNQRAKYLHQMSFYSKIIVLTQTDRPSALLGLQNGR